MPAVPTAGGGGGGSGGGDGNYKRKMEDEGEEEERAAKNPRSASPDFTNLKVACLYAIADICCVARCWYSYNIIVRIFCCGTFLLLCKHFFSKVYI